MQRSELARLDLRTPTSHIDQNLLAFSIRQISSLLDADAFDPDAYTISRLFLATKEAGPRCSETERLWVYVLISQILPPFTWKAHVYALCGSERANCFKPAVDGFLRAFLAVTTSWKRTFYLLLKRSSFSRTLALTGAASTLLDGVSSKDKLSSQAWLGRSSCVSWVC